MAGLATMFLSGDAWRNQRTVSSRRDRRDGRRDRRVLRQGFTITRFRLCTLRARFCGPMKIVPVRASVGRDSCRGRRTLRDYGYRLRALRALRASSREYSDTLSPCRA